jgi:hypothetical protein
VDNIVPFGGEIAKVPGEGGEFVVIEIEEEEEYPLSNKHERVKVNED